MTAMTMDQFFSKCGDYQFHTIHEDGQTPNRIFTSMFYYTNGYATFDGKNWTFELRNK